MALLPFYPYHVTLDKPIDSVSHHMYSEICLLISEFFSKQPNNASFLPLLRKLYYACLAPWTSTSAM